MQRFEMEQLKWIWLASPSQGPLVTHVDSVAGVWTKYKIEVEGHKAMLYVNGAEQPCLIVNDLKLTPQQGGVSLWIEPSSEGYFASLKIRAK